MSEIDKELVSESPVRLVAWEVLGKGANDTLDFDLKSDVALQARVLPGYASPALWPQVVFEPNGRIFLRGDLQEILAVGPERFFRSFHAHLMKARETLRDGTPRPRWQWRRMLRPPKQCRFPPRVFARRTFPEFDNKMRFECRFLEPFDRDRLLFALDKWRPFSGKLVFEQTLGTATPESHLNFRPRYVLRALVKIGINILAYVCDTTVVGAANFPKAIAFARFDENGPRDTDGGFVANADLLGHGCPPDAHKFTLSYDRPGWHLLCSFFGGRIGACVAFPGPNHEDWRWVDVVTPLGSRNWEISKGRLFRPTRLHITWTDIQRILPSVRFRNPEAEIRLEPRLPPKPRP